MMLGYKIRREARNEVARLVDLVVDLEKGPKEQARG